MRKLFNIMIPSLAIAVMIALVPFLGACESLYGDVLRVHILANSDSAADQCLKLCIRDRILGECSAYYDGCEDKAEAERITAAHMDDFRRIALDEIRSRGFGYDVEVRMDEVYFNTRYYDGFTMPAGWYDALRVSIGEAKGANWWCVMYPSLCVGAACREKMAEELDGGEYRVVTSDRLDFRFRIVEYLGEIKKLFGGK